MRDLHNHLKVTNYDESDVKHTIIQNKQPKTLLFKPYNHVVNKKNKARLSY